MTGGIYRFVFVAPYLPLVMRGVTDKIFRLNFSGLFVEIVHHNMYENDQEYIEYKPVEPKVYVLKISSLWEIFTD